MMKMRSYPTYLLVLMGSLDCLTTAVGIIYFGAVELNPFIAGMVNTNLPAFVALKLTTTVFVCLIFVQAEKILMQTQNMNDKAFTWTQKLLKAAYVGIILFMMVVVANNLWVLAKAL
jgi:membrane protein DedA with SNARE-associated domain